VKISRSAVAATQLLTSAAVGNDWLLRRLFELAAAGLPRAPLGARQPPKRPSAPALPAAEDSSQDTEYAQERGVRREGSTGA
jgi:hypothetical protein